MKNIYRIELFVLILWFHACSASAEGVQVEAITKPSSDVLLSFVYGGRVKAVEVREGDVVEQNQLLATQENEVQQLQLKQLALQAGSTARIDALETEIRQKEQDAQKLQWAKGRGAVTSWELDHAQLDLETSRIALVQIRLEHQLAQLKRDELQEQLELFNIRSPVVGQVEKVDIEPGESPQPLTPVIRVVRIDPLLVDVHVPFEKAAAFSLGQNVAVHTIEGNAGAVVAKIVHIAAVADAASMTLRIKLELPNPLHRPAGERVRVQF